MREPERDDPLQARVRAVAARLQRLLDELQRVSWQIWNTVERQRASDAKLLDINMRLQRALAAIPEKSASGTGTASTAGTAAAAGAAGGRADELCFLDWAAPAAGETARAPEPQVRPEPGAHPEPEPRPRLKRRARHASGAFTYLDYLELRAEEFGKFREMPPISDEEIDSFDPDTAESA